MGAEAEAGRIRAAAMVGADRGCENLGLSRKVAILSAAFWASFARPELRVA
jgi:hypothetical protein